MVHSDTLAASSGGDRPEIEIRYFGWSALSIRTTSGVLYFDPFFRPYCNAQWFHLDDFTDASVICVTHGHEEHFLDVPAVAKASGALVVSSPATCRFLRRRNGIAPAQLRPIDPRRFEAVTVPGFTVTALSWKHRDINLYKALSKAVFHGNATQLSWAFHSALHAPFYAPYTGFHVVLPNGVSILNYNEGFNSKMTDGEIRDIARRLHTDILLAGIQLDFVDDVVRGVTALQPKVVILYPPHEHFHAMMGVSSRPFGEFESAVRRAHPRVRVYLAAPGMRFAFAGGDLSEPLAA